MEIHPQYIHTHKGALERQLFPSMYVCMYGCMNGWMDRWIDGCWCGAMISDLDQEINDACSNFKRSLHSLSCK